MSDTLRAARNYGRAQRADVALVPFVPESVLPSQLTGRYDHATPEHRLWLGVLDDAVNCATQRGREWADIRLHARQWFATRSQRVGGFGWVCDHLGLDAGYILRLVEERCTGAERVTMLAGMPAADYCRLLQTRLGYADGTMSSKARIHEPTWIKLRTGALLPTQVMARNLLALWARGGDACGYSHGLPGDSSRSGP